MKVQAFDIIDNWVFFNKNGSRKFPLLSVIFKSVLLKTIQIVHTNTMRWILKRCLSFCSFLFGFFIEKEIDGNLPTKLNDKVDYFNFSIVNKLSVLM